MLLSIADALQRPTPNAPTWALRACALGAAFCFTAMPARAGSQDPPIAGFTATDAVRLALAQSPTVAAARSRLDRATAALRGARAPFNPIVELAPGLGFTNGGAALSQRLDIGGQRTAEARLATGQLVAAAAEIDLVQLRVATAVRSAYFDTVRARAAEAAALESVALARQIRDAVEKRVQIGEAPRVQATRAEIEVARAEQELIRAGSDTQSRAVTLNLLLGRPPSTPVAPSEGLAISAAPDPPEILLARALTCRPELAIGSALVAARRGEVDVARAQRRPVLTVELAADTWSLDRDRFRSGNLGFQARLAFPLLDRGRLRADVDGARSEVRAQEADLQVLRREIVLEVEAAAADLKAAREIALNYQLTIIPRTQDLLRSTRAGFDVGLTSFLDVLDAQRVVRQTQVEYLTALFDAVRARAALDQAVGTVPGLPVTVAMPERSPRK